MNWNTKQQLPNLYNREKNRLEKNEQSFRDLWDYNKRCNICVIGVLKKENEGRTGKVLKRNNGCKLLKFGKRHRPQIQETE